MTTTPLHDMQQDDAMRAETQAVMDWLRNDERTAVRFSQGLLSPMEVAVASVLARRDSYENAAAAQLRHPSKGRK